MLGGSGVGGGVGGGGSPTKFEVLPIGESGGSADAAASVLNAKLLQLGSAQIENSRFESNLDGGDDAFDLGEKVGGGMRVNGGMRVMKGVKGVKGEMREAKTFRIRARAHKTTGGKKGTIGTRGKKSRRNLAMATRFRKKKRVRRNTKKGGRHTFKIAKL
jgi:hypothetical protein